MENFKPIEKREKKVLKRETVEALHKALAGVSGASQRAHLLGLEGMQTELQEMYQRLFAILLNPALDELVS